MVKDPDDEDGDDDDDDDDEDDDDEEEDEEEAPTQQMNLQRFDGHGVGAGPFFESFMAPSPHQHFTKTHHGFGQPQARILQTCLPLGHSCG